MSMAAYKATWLRHLFAMLCVVQCLVLSAQANTVMLDQIDHALGAEHEANAMAGPVLAHVHGPDHHHDHVSGFQKPHDHDEQPTAKSDPAHHEHAGDGLLTSWVIQASYSVEHFAARATVRPPVLTGQGYPFRNRQDRPPKSLA